MALLITDRSLEHELMARRAASGADRYDEVWEGTYVMAPLADDAHQELQLGIAACFLAVVANVTGAKVRAGVNVSDRDVDWTFNYRVPDVVVFMPSGVAVNHETHWRGGPDLIVEIASPGDDTREKLPFYGRIGVRELILVDRDPWAIERYVLRNQKLILAGHSTLPDSKALKLDVLSLSVRLIAGPKRPAVELVLNDGKNRWTV